MKITIMTPEIKELEANAAAWEKRCEELEQELREAQERVQEQNMTIAKYDDENWALKARQANMPFKDSLNDLAKRIHEIAVKHGWWAQPPMAAANSRAPRENAENGASPEAGADRFADDDKPFPEIVALCHSELSEALEEYRNDKPMAYQVQSYGIVEGRVETDPAKWFPASKPEGVAVEMLDCMIRILDWCGHEGIDVDTLMARKVMYNKKRPYRHGGKKA